MQPSNLIDNWLVKTQIFHKYMLMSAYVNQKRLINFKNTPETLIEKIVTYRWNMSRFVVYIRSPKTVVLRKKLIFKFYSPYYE